MYCHVKLMKMLLKVCLLLIMSVPLMMSDTEVTTTTTMRSSTVATTNCPSMLREGQPTWKEEPSHLQVYLNETNVVCALGDCSFLNSTQYSNSTKNILHLTVQANDIIRVIYDLKKDYSNGSDIITVSEYNTSACDISESHLQSANDTDELILDKETLKSGIHVLLIRASWSYSDCALIWHLNITVKNHECSRAKDSVLCSATGYCGDHKSTGIYTCSCCPGFVGKYCEEKDACYGNPCQHGGFCVDIAEGLVGNTFQCLCPHGYRGRSCEGEVSLCDRRPCMNEGSCHGNQTHYTCLCPRGFSGTDCETNINECLSNPCIHGVCEDGVGGYKCYCLPGYGGDHCEFEYDECDSSPCINGGACEDLVAGYRCHCGPGYKGRRCQIKVDLCTPNPCPEPAQCVDRGNNYSCICHPGYTSPGCTQHYDPCYPNPCQHAGTCWPSLDSYFCSCGPGYTGDLCEEALFTSQPLPRKLEDPGEPEERVRHKGTLDDDVPVDHWHNVYLAGTMLALAGTLVLLGGLICHCKTHKTYLAFTRKLSRSCSEIAQQKIEDPGKFSMNLRGSVSESPPEAATAYEATSVDVTESLNAPLIV